MKHDMMSTVLASALLSVGGGRPLMLDHRRDMADELIDRLDILALVTGTGPLSEREPYRVRGGHVTFVDTPKPISKRKARRLRGRRT